MPSRNHQCSKRKPLLTGLVIGESPRWHEGRLWFANWGAEEIVAVDLDGNARSSVRDRPASGGRSTGCPTVASW